MRPTNKHAAVALEAVRLGSMGGHERAWPRMGRGRSRGSGLPLPMGRQAAEHMRGCLRTCSRMAVLCRPCWRLQTMFSESVLQPSFPDIILRPGEEYQNQVRF